MAISRYILLKVQELLFYYIFSFLFNYDVEQLHFYIRDIQKTKRTATQENEIKPLYISGDTVTVKGHAENTWIVAIQKLTIPDGKYLAIEVMEKNSGRNLFIKVKNRQIMKTQTIL